MENHRRAHARLSDGEHARRADLHRRRRRPTRGVQHRCPAHRRLWGDDIGLDSPPEQLELAKRTLRQINVWPPHRGYLTGVRRRLGIYEPADGMAVENFVQSHTAGSACSRSFHVISKAASRTSAPRAVSSSRPNGPRPASNRSQSPRSPQRVCPRQIPGQVRRQACPTRKIAICARERRSDLASIPTSSGHTYVLNPLTQLTCST